MMLDDIIAENPSAARAFAALKARGLSDHAAREELAAIPLQIARVALARGPTLDADGKHRLAVHLGILAAKMYDAIARGEDPGQHPGCGAGHGRVRRRAAT